VLAQDATHTVEHVTGLSAVQLVKADFGTKVAFEYLADLLGGPWCG
jgi:hypothetical protein